jgi:hypothetical protein
MKTLLHSDVYINKGQDYFGQVVKATAKYIYIKDVYGGHTDYRWNEDTDRPGWWKCKGNRLTGTPLTFRPNPLVEFVFGDAS